MVWALSSRNSKGSFCASVVRRRLVLAPWLCAGFCLCRLLRLAAGWLRFLGFLGLLLVLFRDLLLLFGRRLLQLGELLLVLLLAIGLQEPDLAIEFRHSLSSPVTFK